MGKAPAKKKESSDDSDDSDEMDEEPVKKAPAPVKVPAKKAPAKKQESSSDEESEEEETEEEVKPKKASKKNSVASLQEKVRKDSGNLSNLVSAKNAEVRYPADRNNNEVIIRGLPFSATEDDVTNFFAECGEISRINLLRNYDGSSKGLGFVTFVENSAVCFAEDLSESEFGGRQVFIEQTKPKEQRNPGQGRDWNRGNDRQQRQASHEGDRPARNHSNEECTVFVGNLSFNTEVDKLWDLFGPCGNIKDVRLGKKPDGSSRGFAHIEFDSEEAAQKAMSMAGRKLDGRQLNVDSSTKKSGGGGGGRGGFGGDRGGGRGGFRGGRGGFGGDEGLAARKGHIDLSAKNQCM